MMDHELNDWAAEHLLGIERGNCQGLYGGGNANADGTCESWIVCDWCHRDFGVPGPCPAYPFPAVTLQQVMQALGERGLHVFVRYDPLREQAKWTVLIGRGMVGSDVRCDTDDPLTTLIKLAKERISELVPSN